MTLFSTQKRICLPPAYRTGKKKLSRFEGSTDFFERRLLFLKSSMTLNGDNDIPVGSVGGCDDIANLLCGVLALITVDHSESS